MLQHEFSDKELYDGFIKQFNLNAEDAERAAKVLDEWVIALTTRAKAAKGFILVNKENKREYQIRRIWPDKAHSIEVILVKPTKADLYSIWEANLHEFEITNRRVET